MSRVTVVDDQAISLKILERLAESIDGVDEVLACADPQEALSRAGHLAPDLVLVDFRMPSMDGAQFIERFRGLNNCAEVPVIVVTAARDKEVLYRALEAGATDFLTKPVDHIEFKARTRNLLALRKHQLMIANKARWLETQVEQATRDIRTREYETLLRLAKAGEYRDEETGNHIIRMARYSRLIGERLGLDSETCETIEVAAPMHDIGKIGISDNILLKPGRLTETEFEVMKNHTVIGYEILKGSPSKYLQMGADIALGHHEKFNGNGYPSGLSGDGIPLPARIVAVADVYDALTSTRPYKRAWSNEEALAFLDKESGQHFDPECVNAFNASLGDVRSIQKAFSDQEADALKVKQ